MIINVIKIFLPTTLAFLIGIAITPRLTTYMYSHKMWRKKKRSDDGEITNDTYKKIHDGSAEVSTPRVGGIIIWLATLLCIGIIWILAKSVPSDLTSKLDFYSRSQTLVPLATLLFGAGIGLIDDIAQIRGITERVSHRYLKMAIVIGIGIAIGIWFYTKLGVHTIAIPFSTTTLYLGIWFIPFFIVVLLSVFSSSVIDGMDGLAGGVFAVIFAAYAIIAFGQNQIDIAAFSGVIAGSILAFLWFNIPPARFYMGETGILGLTTTLTVIAFLTDTVLILPLIAFPLVATVASNIIQITSYKYFGKRRVFKIAPLHHHFHALGWSKEKIVMRYWVVSVICALLGVVITFISK